MITSCFCTTPSASLEVLLGTPPVHLIIMADARITNYRIAVSSFPEIRNLKDKFLTEKQNEKEIYWRSNSDYISPRYVFERKFKVEFPSREQWLAGEVLPVVSDMTFYTDGSKTDMGTGYGIFRVENSYCYYNSLERTSNICQAEMQGILTCANYILYEEVSADRNIIIASDSKSALEAIQSYKVSSLQTLYCIEKLNEVGSNNVLRLIWVPGHLGIDGNEKADELARKGSSLNHALRDFTCGVTMSVIKADIKKLLQEESFTYFQNTKGLRQSKKFIHRIDLKRTQELLAMTKEQIRWTVGIFTGHGKFKYHLKRIKKLEDASCRYCHMEDETAEHLLCDCIELTGRRMNILRRHHLDPPDLDGYRLSRLYKFLDAIGITKDES